MKASIGFVTAFVGLSVLSGCASGGSRGISSESSPPVYEDLLLKEGGSLSCSLRKNPYRSDVFELTFDNPSKTYRVSVPTVHNEPTRLQALKRFEGRPLWCVFKDAFVFSCTTQDLRRNSATVERDAETFSVRRSVRYVLESGREGKVAARLNDYLDFEVLGEGEPRSDLGRHLPYNFFATEHCRAPKRWF